MKTKFALVCDTVFQGPTVSPDDFYDTQQEAQAELDDMNASRYEAAIQAGEEPEGDDEDFSVERVTQQPDGTWHDDFGKAITVTGDEP
jgi:hypothetical protein